MDAGAVIGSGLAWVKAETFFVFSMKLDDGHGGPEFDGPATGSSGSTRKKNGNLVLKNH